MAITERTSNMAIGRTLRYAKLLRMLGHVFLRATRCDCPGASPTTEAQKEGNAEWS